MVDRFAPFMAVVIAEPLTATIEKPEAKFRVGEMAAYRSKKGNMDDYKVVWIGPDKYDPNIIRVALKKAGRYRPFFVNQDLCEPAV